MIGKKLSILDLSMADGKVSSQNKTKLTQKKTTTQQQQKQQ